MQAGRESLQVFVSLVKGQAKYRICFQSYFLFFSPTLPPLP